MSDIITVTVSVPAARVGDLYAYVAELHDGGGTSAGTSEETGPARKRAGNGFGRNTVRKNYFGGTSQYWKPFLDRLAEDPDEWVAWSVLCKAIDLDAKSASGMLGAAERRCKGYPPYEKSGYDSESAEHWFRMPGEVAKYVKEAAAELDD